MRRVLISAAVILLTAACGSSTQTPVPQPASHAAQASASPSLAPSLPHSVLMSLDAISKDTKKIAHDRGDDQALAADCRQLGTDASSAGVDKLTDPAVHTQWVKATGELQKAADECSSGASTGDDATMQQALTDLTAASDDLTTFYNMTP